MSRNYCRGLHHGEVLREATKSTTVSGLEITAAVCTTASQYHTEYTNPSKKGLEITAAVCTTASNYLFDLYWVRDVSKLLPRFAPRRGTMRRVATSLVACLEITAAVCTTARALL